jgi:hypothetical protein
MPNSTPSSGAPASPALGMTDGLTMRPANMNRSNAPKNSRPSRTVTPPRTRVIPAECDWSSSPIPPTVRPISEKTTENPSTNSAVPATIRPRGALAGPFGAVAGAAVTVAVPGPPTAATAEAAAPGELAVRVAARLPPEPAPDMPVM